MTTYKVKTPSGWVYIDNQNYDARYILASSKGSNSGVASLDESGHVIFDQLPSSITGAVNYRGVFDPTEGAPSPAAAGYYYVSSGVGTISEISFSTGDWLVYTDGSSWNKIANSSASVTWSNVSDKPASYTPDTHDNTSHSVEYITVDDVTYEALLANDDIGTGATQVAAGNHTHSGYQPIDGDLTAIAGLSGSAGLLRKTASNTWTLDTNTYFTELSTVGNATNWDTASRPSFTGNALKYLRLNAAGNAFEFATVETGVSSFTSLTDTPANYTDASLKYVRVNESGNALEFATVSATVDIHGTDSTSEFTTGDEVLIYDSSLGENRKILRGNFFNGLEGDYISIHGTFEETTPATNMEVLVYDPSVPANRRMTRANFLDGISAVGAFTDLTDTPASYEGYDETYYVRVNAASNALEFATVPSSYTLPTASAETLGGVKIGSGITITDGVISVTGGSGGGSELTFASGETDVTLPGTPSNGQIYEYVGTGDVWTITANTGQTIRLLGYTGNTLTAEHPYACVGLVFFNNVWIVRTQVGTLDLSTV